MPLYNYNQNLQIREQLAKDRIKEREMVRDKNNRLQLSRRTPTFVLVGVMVLIVVVVVIAAFLLH